MLKPFRIATFCTSKYLPSNPPSRSVDRWTDKYLQTPPKCFLKVLGVEEGHFRSEQNLFQALESGGGRKE